MLDDIKIKDIYEKEIVMLPNSILYPHQRKAWTGFNKIMKKFKKGVKLLILEWHRRLRKRYTSSPAIS